MITYRELKELSLDFRRLSSNLLNATYDNADVQLERFKKFIDATPFIYENIYKKTSTLEYDYNECFVCSTTGGWTRICVPSDESCHLKAMYDYLTIINEEDTTVYQHARAYSSSSKINEMIQNFLSDAFKPLIDYITDTISKEIIFIEEERRLSSMPITQNIGTVYGTVNQQGSGSIVSQNTTNTCAAEICDLIAKIVPTLNFFEETSQDDLDDVKDDLESVSEQVMSSTPKKNRIQKALSGIKKFSGDVFNKTLVSIATKGITSADWNTLISKIELFLETLS